ncbi:hypothetical protein BH09PSE5_BH09PSE5_26050 [soil metagenome]
MPIFSPHTLSVSMARVFFHWPVRTKRSLKTVRRMVARINAKALSATHSLSTSGVLVMVTLWSRAASASMPS